MRKLYTFFRSSTSYRVRIALEVKGLEWDPSFVSLPAMEHRSDAYFEISPQRLVPALVEDGTVLTQSLAILEYLDEAYPDPPIMPSELRDRAYVRSLAQIIGCDIHPLNNVRVLKYLQREFDLDENATHAWYRHWIDEGFRAFEATLIRADRSGQFCLGDQVTIADICLVPQVANARRFNCDLSSYPRSIALAESAMRLPAFRRAEPAGQADAF